MAHWLVPMVTPGFRIVFLLLKNVYNSYPISKIITLGILIKMPLTYQGKFIHHINMFVYLTLRTYKKIHYTNFVSETNLNQT